MNHFISENNENYYLTNYADEYEDSRINVVLEYDVFGNINYIPFHEAEGYGYFKQMSLDETPAQEISYFTMLYPILYQELVALLLQSYKHHYPMLT